MCNNRTETKISLFLHDLRHFPPDVLGSSYLQFVDVGWMVPGTTLVRWSFTATLWDNQLVLLNPHIVSPVGVVVTPATFKLDSGMRNRY